jgi:hypothetical protein
MSTQHADIGLRRALEEYSTAIELLSDSGEQLDRKATYLVSRAAVQLELHDCTAAQRDLATADSIYTQFRRYNPPNQPFETWRTTVASRLDMCQPKPIAGREPLFGATSYQ